jgi:hypothetical protein
MELHENPGSRTGGAVGGRLPAVAFALLLLLFGLGAHGAASEWAPTAHAVSEAAATCWSEVRGAPVGLGESRSCVAAAARAATMIVLSASGLAPARDYTPLAFEEGMHP